MLVRRGESIQGPRAHGTDGGGRGSDGEEAFEVRALTRRSAWRIRAQYMATSVVLIVWGDDWDEAQHRASYYQKGAMAYCFLEELTPADPRCAVAL